MGDTAPAKPAPDLMQLLSQATHALSTELTSELAAIGSSPRTHCVLTTAMTGTLTQSQLAELCALDKTTMVVTIDELETAGLAERQPSSTDRRARIIAVTAAGYRLVTRAHKIINRTYADVLAALPSGQREVFVNGLVRLVDSRLATPVRRERPSRRRARQVRVSR